MEYVFILNEGYHETTFVFRDYVQGCSFMAEAIDHIESEKGVNFTVYKMEEKEEGAEDGE